MLGWIVALVVAPLGFVAGWWTRGVFKEEAAFERGRKFEAERQARENY